MMDNVNAPEVDSYLEEVDTVIVSDIHLGSNVSRARRLMELLQSMRYRRLILNGDVFDDLNFRRLSGDDWKFLSMIRKLSNPRKGIDVVWVVGNHDGGVSEVLSHLLGVPVHEEYLWEQAGIRFLAVHGHQFDTWITEHQVLTALATWMYLVVQRIDPQHRASRWVKRTSKKWLRLSDKVGRDASIHGRNVHQADVVVCGHTHQPTDTLYDGVRYLNSGCWTDVPSHYVVVADDGSITLRDYH